MLKFRLELRNVVSIAICLTVTVLNSCSGSSGGGKSAKIKMINEAGSEVFFTLGGSGTATVDWGDKSEKVTLTLNESGVDFKHTYPSATIRTIIINGENITRLRCGSDFTSLDLSKNTELTFLQLRSCYKIESLDLRKTTALKYLWLSECYSIKSLDLSNNSLLTSLKIYATPLNSLDVSKNVALTELDVSMTYQLKNLDVSNNTILKSLSVNGNQLSSLDLSKNTVLTYLDCSGNGFTDSALNSLFGSLHSNTIQGGIKIYPNPGAYSCDRNIAERKGWRVY